MKKSTASFFLFVLVLLAINGWFNVDSHNRIKNLEETNAALCTQLDAIYTTATDKTVSDKEINNAILAILINHEERIEKIEYKKFVKTDM